LKYYFRVKIAPISYNGAL